MIITKHRHAVVSYGCHVVNEIWLSRFEQIHFAWSLGQWLSLLLLTFRLRTGPPQRATVNST